MLPPPSSLCPGGVSWNTVELQPEKEAVLSLRETSEHGKETSSSEVSTFREVLSASNLCSARGRIRRESRCQSFQGEGQSLDLHLTRQLSTHLNKLELIPRENERVSVIVPNTPSRSPLTSTPSNSPHPPPFPRRVCHTLGPITLPRNRSPSPCCSDISSINGEVFSDPEGIESSSKLSLAQAAPGTPLLVPPVTVTNTMEAGEKDVKRKDEKLHYRMRTMDPTIVNEASLHKFDPMMKEFEEMAEDLCMAVWNLCLESETVLGAEKVKALKDRQVFVENEVRH